MTEVASRELRHSTRSLLDRVESVETLTITVDDLPQLEELTVTRV